MILITGGMGFLGKTVARNLQNKKNPFITTSLSLGLDLRDRKETELFFNKHKPTSVIHCAAYVGGLQFGLKNPVDVFENNMQITLNVFHASRLVGVKRVIHPISNCIYPGKAHFFKEDAVWEGELHESVQAYGGARKALYLASQAYQKQYGLDVLNLVLSNMYGPDDHFQEERSHALGALVQKFVTAKRNSLPRVTVWGTGAPVREWLYVEDAAEALVRGLAVPAQKHLVNIGHGHGVSIKDLAKQIAQVVGYQGEIYFDVSQPDGAPFKTVDGSRGEALLGWKPATPLSEGLQKTIKWFEENF